MITNNPENDAALKALGIRKGVTYHVVPVSCTQNDCLSYAIEAPVNQLPGNECPIEHQDRLEKERYGI